jgi:hypothetical protein
VAFVPVTTGSAFAKGAAKRARASDVEKNILIMEG